MTCLVLTGGLGTRLRSIAGDLPKSLVRIGTRPFLEYLVLQLHQQDFNDIVLCTGYRGDKIQEYFGDGTRWQVRIRYSKESKPLGTGGAIQRGSRLTEGEVFLAMNGDSYLEADLRPLVRFHAAGQSRATVALVEVEDAERFGRVELGSDGRILRFEEKGRPGPGLISAGVYVFDRRVFEEIPNGPISLEKDVLPSLIGRGVYGMPSNGNFVDIGVPEEYRRLKANPGVLVRLLYTPASGKPSC